MKAPTGIIMTLKENPAIIEYAQHAADYDQRWRSYNKITAAKTLSLLQTEPTAKDQALVDIGCGTGLLLKIVSHSYPAIKLHGCDITPAMITKARLALGSAVDLQVAAAEKLPYVQKQFDFAVCNSAAQHFLSIPNALREAERVLKPGGQFVLTAWSTDELMPRLHYKLLQARNVAIQQVMSSAEYCKQLELAGFCISAVQPFRAGPQWGLISISASKSH